MKVVLGLLCVVLFNYAASETKTYPRGCIYAIGKCIKECEVGTHAYTTGCGTLTPEPTCDNPTPKPDGRGGHICDFSACYCDPPTVRDVTQKKCVKLEECPKKDDKKDKNDDKKDKNDDKKDKKDDKKDNKDDKKDKKDDKKD